MLAGVGGEYSRQDSRHAIVDLHPRADLAGESLGEKLHRQTQNVPEEFAAGSERQPGFDGQQDVLLQPCQQPFNQNRACHRQQKGLQPVVQASNQNVVDVYAREHRRHQVG